MYPSGIERCTPHFGNLTGNHNLTWTLRIIVAIYSTGNHGPSVVFHCLYGDNAYYKSANQIARTTKWSIHTLIIN